MKSHFYYIFYILEYEIVKTQPDVKLIRIQRLQSKLLVCHHNEYGKPKNSYLFDENICCQHLFALVLKINIRRIVKAWECNVCTRLHGLEYCKLVQLFKT